MFTGSVVIDQPGGTENVPEDTLDVSRENTNGQGERILSSIGESPEEPVSRPFTEVLPSEDLSLDAQPEPDEQEHKTTEFADTLEQDAADSVSDLKKANDELRRRLEDHQREIEGLRKMLQVSADVIQAIPAGLFLFQYQHPGELFFLNCNPEATRLTGLGQEDCRGVELDEIWPNARTQGLTEAFLEVARTGKPFDVGKALYRNSKIERVFRVKAFAIPGERLGVTLLELTEQRQTQEAIRRVRKEMDRQIEEKTSELLALNLQWETECSNLRESQEMALASCRLEAQEAVAGRVARVLSSPIENVQESATRALARLDSGYMSLVRPSLKQIVQDVEHVCCLVKHLRQFAGIAPSGGPSQCKAVDLNAVVSECAEALSCDAEGSDRKDVTPVLEELILGQDCCVKCEPSEIRDVVDALLHSVASAAHRRGGVTVKTFSEENFVVLELGDEGRSISENEVSEMFEPFWTSGLGHAGLGLAAVSGVVRRYGGEVGVVSNPGQGITITVRLPRADGP